ncbi:MAG: OmpA family protein [Crocinitomicaceae bacterium]
MKRQIIFALLLTAVCSFNTKAQTEDRKFSIGLHSGITDYYSDVDLRWFNFDKATRAHIGLNAMYNLNPWFNVGIMGDYGSIGTLNVPTGHMRASMIHANAQLRLRFNNGTILSEDSKFQPYVYVGTGLSTYLENGPSLLVNKGTDWTGNAGAGVTYMITDLIGVNYNLNYALTNADRRDFISEGHNDQFMQHSLGLVFHLGKKKDNSNAGGTDSDGDGVEDTKDDCANTPVGVAVDKHGCPVDSDKDGVADYEDNCPEEAGTAENFGCPALDEETQSAFDNAVNIHFETGSDVITKDSYNSLDAIVALMKSHGKYKLDINGHTDSSGDDQLNLNLSKKRAESVKTYLVNKGVDETRLRAQGFGETQPLFPNDTAENKAKNRRVEFRVRY